MSGALTMSPRHITLLILIAGVLAGFSAIGHIVDFASLLDPERIIALLKAAGPLGPLALIGGMATAVVISPIPSLPLDLAAGAAYGPLLGTAYVVLGAEIGAVLSFLLARALGREVLHKLLKLDIRFCERCSDRHLVTVLVLARLLPIFSFDVISYGAGLTNMSLMTFALATLAGMIPPTLAFTYFGSSVRSAQWPLILASAIMVVLFLVAPNLVARYPNSWWARLFFAGGPPPRVRFSPFNLARSRQPSRVAPGAAQARPEVKSPCAHLANQRTSGTSALRPATTDSWILVR